MQRRDTKGRFTGSGAIGAATRSTSTGSHALRSARTMKTEIGGAKERVKRDARQGSNTARRRGAPTVAASYSKDANRGKQKVRKMERERKSLLRRSQRG